MGHRALTRQKRKCRLARQMSMTMLTMQVRAMASCTGRSMARKGKATMAPPMPLTPDTKPPAIQARNTQISVIPGIRPSCGHGRPSVDEIKLQPLAAPPADSRWRADSARARPSSIRTVMTAPARDLPWSVSPSIRSKTACAAGPAPHGTSRSTGGGTSVRQPAAPCGIAPREAGLACGAFRATAPPLPAPARLQHGPRSPCLGRERPFGNRGKRKKA